MKWTDTAVDLVELMGSGSSRKEVVMRLITYHQLDDISSWNNKWSLFCRVYFF